MIKRREISCQRSLLLFGYMQATNLSLNLESNSFCNLSLSKCSALDLSEKHKTLHLPLSHMKCQVEFLYFNDFILGPEKKNEARKIEELSEK